jgi:hypothetical protein
MKRHEACHWINVLIADTKRRIEYRREEAELAGAYNDTEEQKAARSRYSAERIAELEKQLQALDMAGDALTK